MSQPPGRDGPAPAAPGAAFAPAVPGWRHGLGRLRDAVRQEVVRRQLAGLPQLARPARVLDAGCGQGTQLLHLARAGHQVTGLDTSAELLAACAADLAAEPPEVAARVTLTEGPAQQAARLAPGPFDLVACHGVLMYAADDGPLLRALAAVAAPGAAISLLVRNGLALALRPGLAGDGRAALAAFGGREYVNRLGLAARAHAPADLDAVLGPLGWRRTAWYGVRVFTDHRDEPAPDPAVLAPLLDAEEEAGRRDPYRRVAALSHLVYGRVES